MIIPVYNGAAHLERCLSALSRSCNKDYECVVVDDGSTDASRQVAERHGARVIALPRPHGPAHARNRGAQAAAGDLLLFIDADICVHPDTLAAVAAVFQHHPDLGALMGSYDSEPGDPSFFSQYKNLFHHYVHQSGREEASTFWSGCGAIRRSLFLAAGGFDERYTRPCIEDIELGSRLRRAGHRIRLEKEIQVTHWKRWRFVDLVRTDLFRRGVPWMALMLRDRHLVGDLNLNWQSRLSALLTYLLTASLLALVAAGNGQVWAPVLAWVGWGVLTASLYDRTRPQKGRWAAAFGLLLMVTGLRLAAGAGWPTLAPLALLLAILAMHHDFYRFWVHRRGIGFAVAVVPYHLLYFLYSGLAVPLGIIAGLRDQLKARAQAERPSAAPGQPMSTAGGRVGGDQAPDRGWIR